MPPPGMRRRRPSLGDAGSMMRQPPGYILRRREDGWNGRFGVDGPSVRPSTQTMHDLCILIPSLPRKSRLNVDAPSQKTKVSTCRTLLVRVL